jgi:RNA polymerase sigma-70 factor (ECF subfamily)
MAHRAPSEDAWSDRVAFAVFYDGAVRELYRYFHRGTAGDRCAAEDLVQETFMAVMKSFQAGHPDSITMPWTMGIARHKLIDHYRRAARHDRKLSLAFSSAARVEESSEFDSIDASEALELLESLSPSHRLVLLLRYVDDLPVADVASLIGSSVRATESLIVRARHALEARLREVHSA